MFHELDSKLVIVVRKSGHIEFLLHTFVIKHSLMSEIKLEFDKICRVCMSDENPLHCIFAYEVDGNCEDLSIKMEICGGVVIKTDGMPEKICESCIDLLNRAYTYRVLSVKSESLLKERVQFVQSADLRRLTVENNENYLPNNDEKSETNVVLKKQPKSKKSFQCAQCNATFNSKSTHSQHILLHSKKYICEICGQKFTRNYHLKQHLPTHTGEKRHKCPQCNYQTRYNSCLRVHARIHLNDRPYACEMCGFTTRTCSNLYAHRRTHEPNSKRFKCHICTKLFCYKRSLNEHVAATHQGFMEYACHVCETRFTRMGVLTKHIKRKHPQG